MPLRQEMMAALCGRNVRKMRKIALSDEILLTIEKPARYIGNEVNAAMKDKNAVDVSFVMCSRTCMRSVCLIWNPDII